MKLLSACAFASLIALTACGQGTSDHGALLAETVGQFPLHPETSMTPGALCTHPDSYRYAEHVAYCNRNVSSETKKGLFVAYDTTFGFKMDQMDRAAFKIDHFIPLCMGGANDTANLWPQHKTVYVQTDKIELELCQLMEAGKMQQAEAVATMKHVKFNLGEAAALQSSLTARLQ